MKKGARVGVSGQLCVQTWIDKTTGQDRKSPRVVVKTIEILETKAEAGLREKNANRGPEENGFWEPGGRGDGIGREGGGGWDNESKDIFD